MDIATAEGVPVDSPKADVLAAYGTHSYSRSAQGASIIGCIDKSPHRTLEFWFFNDRVNTIRLDLSTLP